MESGPNRSCACAAQTLVTGASWPAALVFCRRLRAQQREPVASRAVYNFNLEGGWYLITDLIATVNWNARDNNKWTIPLGGGAGKLFKIGNLPINAWLAGAGRQRIARCRNGL